VIRDMQVADVTKVVAVHLEAFPDSFLSLLGRGGLALIYKDFAQNGFAYVFGEGDDIAGFLAGSFTPARNFYKQLVRRNPARVSLYLARATIRNPSLLKSILNRAKGLFSRGAGSLESKSTPNAYQTIVEAAGNVAHVLSIATAPVYRRRGIADKLWTHLLRELPIRGVDAIVGSSLGENDPTNILCERKGFKIAACVPRPDGGEELKWVYYRRGHCTVLDDGSVTWNPDGRQDCR